MDVDALVERLRGWSVVLDGGAPLLEEAAAALLALRAERDALREALKTANGEIVRLYDDIGSRVYRSEELRDAEAWVDVDAHTFNGHAASILEELAALAPASQPAGKGE